MHALLSRCRSNVILKPKQQAVHPNANRCTTPRAKIVPKAGQQAPSQLKKVALLFDCDGVIVETEDLHRRSYNAAFEAFEVNLDGNPVIWDVNYYDILQNTVGGGKGKMKFHFNENGWPLSRGLPTPVSDEEKDALVDKLQDEKTVHYKAIVENAAEARPGILKLMDEALDHPDVAVCVCSASSKEGFLKVVQSVLGQDRLSRLDVILAGDDVSKKKPDPQIYNIAQSRLGIPADRCIVIEDAMVGLRAAKGAGMHCVITPTHSTASQPFLEEGATYIFKEGLATDTTQVTVDSLFSRVLGDTWAELEPVVPA